MHAIPGGKTLGFFPVSFSLALLTFYWRKQILQLDRFASGYWLASVLKPGGRGKPKVFSDFKEFTV